MKLRMLTALILMALVILAGCQEAVTNHPSPNARISHSAMGSDAHAVAKLNAEITHYRSPAVRFLDDLFRIER